MSQINIPKTVKAGRKKKAPALATGDQSEPTRQLTEQDMQSYASLHYAGQPGLAQPSTQQRQPASGGPQDLEITIREQELSKMLLSGRSRKEIASHYGISLYRLNNVIKGFNAGSAAKK